MSYLGILHNQDVERPGSSLSQLTGYISLTKELYSTDDHLTTSPHYFSNLYYHPLWRRGFCQEVWPERGGAAGRACLGAPMAAGSGGRRRKRKVGLKETAESYKIILWIYKKMQCQLFHTCRKYFSNTDLRSASSSMASFSILSTLFLNSFNSLNLMSFSSKVSLLVFCAERISLVSLEH